MRSILSKLWNRKRWRDEDTREALDQPVPPEAAALPLDLPLGRWPLITALTQLSGITALLIMHVVGVGLYVDRVAASLIVAGLLLGLFCALYRQSIAGRHIWITEYRIRVQRLIATEELLWPNLRAVETDRQLTSLRFIRVDGKSSWVSLAPLSVDDRKRVVIAVRARAEFRNVPVGLRTARRWSPLTVLPGLRVTAEIVATMALFWALSHTSFALGMRCSAGSNYLRTRFTEPERPGCVVLRVSGAAGRAGLRQGDLLIEMNGHPVTSGAQFSVLFHASGWHYSLVVLRAGEQQPLHFDFNLSKGGEQPHTDRSDPLFFFLRARLDAANGKVDGPIADYTKAIALDPNFDLAYVYRADLFTDGPRRDLALAEADILKALELTPDLGEAHRYAAYVYRDEGRRPEALAELMRAIQLDGCEGGFTGYNVDCARDYMALSTVVDTQDRLAYAQYEDRSIDFYSGFSQAYYAAAWHYFEAGDTATAGDRARSYLAFPKSQRDPMKDWEVTNLILTPKGTVVPPPPLAKVTPLQFFDEQGSPVPYVTFTP